VAADQPRRRGHPAGIGLGRSPGRRWWVATAVVAVAALTSIGLLSAFGVVGTFIVA
jgi:hypothetical protein